MSAVTTIAWTDRTWNPVRGCSIVSPGCVNCYAMKQAHRFSGKGQPYAGLTKRTPNSGPQWTGVVRTVEDALLEPLSWRKPARVFVNSMSDLFHESVPAEFIAAVFGVMASAPRHTFQVLTKRPERMRNFFIGWPRPIDCVQSARRYGVEVGWPVVDRRTVLDREEWPLPNVWLGVSCENQQTADERIPLLLQTPAAVRWVSAEPLLESINFRDIQPMRGKTHIAEGLRPLIHFPEYDVMRGEKVRDRMGFECPRLDWVVVGGESGAGARPFDLAWGRSIVQQCQAANVPVFVKQLGARAYGPDTHSAILRDRKGGDPSEWPSDLRVREYPLTSLRAG